MKGLIIKAGRVPSETAFYDMQSISLSTINAAQAVGRMFTLDPEDQVGAA